MALELGFDHLDVVGGEPGDPGDLVLPVGDRIAFPDPRPGCSHPAPPAGEGAWDRAVAAYRRAPGARMEPWPGSVCGSTETTLAMLEEVPGLRLLVDVGHVAAWGGDPLELLPWADHVQLRQAGPGRPQAHADDGTVDFAAVFDRLEELRYRGRLSVEYFDLPGLGWPLDDPVAYAVELAEHVRPLLAPA
ncbi:MAG: sugar phosphate isomerase/epimerase [Acidimicrobiia bacterium]|nr:sugar phosphate isomerase/epimerase [Acidimicrobiia bacterium]